MYKRVIIWAVLVIALLVGCGRRDVEKNGYNRFRVIERYKDGYEIVDVDTGNGYFVFYDNYTCIPLYDEYGKPYKENGWRDYGE